MKNFTAAADDGKLLNLTLSSNGPDYVAKTGTTVTVTGKFVRINTAYGETYSKKCADNATALALGVTLEGYLNGPRIVTYTFDSATAPATKTDITSPGSNFSLFTSVAAQLTGVVAGGTVTAQLQESIDGTSWVDVSGAVFTTVTGTISAIVTGTIKGKYLRWNITKASSPTGTVTFTLLLRQ